MEVSELKNLLRILVDQSPTVIDPECIMLACQEIDAIAWETDLLKAKIQVLNAHVRAMSQSAMSLGKQMEELSR